MSPPPETAPLAIAVLVELPAEGVAALASSAFGPFVLHGCAGRAEAESRLAAGCAALLLDGAAAASDALAAAAGPDVALLVVLPGLDAPAALHWLQRGAQEVLLRDELGAPSLALRLRAAIERQRAERRARTAYATDLDTGLPHQQQLIEHMSQLLALREREPAPMAVLALRVEGLASAQARFGRAAASVLRRKLGVRLRAGVRASDVVASLGDDGFAVLLVSILTPADAARVGEKLLRSLMDPLRVAGHDLTVATAIGIGHYPQDGAQPDALLRHALAAAAAAPAQGRAGFSNFGEVDAAATGAANDE